MKKSAVIINKEYADALKNAAITNRLVDRIERLAQAGDRTLRLEDLKITLNVLRALKRRDSNIKKSLSADPEGWYDATFMEPEQYTSVEVLTEDGKTTIATKDEVLWWSDEPGKYGPVALVEKWRFKE